MSTNTHAKNPPECMQNYRMHTITPEIGTFEEALGCRLVAYDPDDIESEWDLVHEYTVGSLYFLVGDALALFYATPDEPIVLDCAGKRIVTTPEDPNWRDASGNILTFLDLVVLLHTSERVRLVTTRDNDK